MSTMTAWFGGSGPIWERREVDVPTPGPGQVLVRAEAWSLNNADLSALDGIETYLAGYELAGDVVSAGADVDIAAGTPVMGTVAGAFAENVLVDARHVFRRPDGLSVTDAAALPTALLTEHGALQAGGFRAGQSVLITGATSSIGLVGVQIARELGARQIIATTRSSTHASALQGLGADRVVATSDESLTDAVLEATGGDGVDLVLDHVGGGTFADCLPATKVDGAVVNIGRLGGAAATIDLDAISYRHLTVRGVSFGFTRAEELGRVVAEAQDALLGALSSRRVRAIVDGVLPFDDAPAAAERLRSGNPFGKIVLARD